jgi:hypothetical protein
MRLRSVGWRPSRRTRDLFGVEGRDWLAGLELPAEERESVDAAVRNIELLWPASLRRPTRRRRVVEEVVVAARPPSRLARGSSQGR